MTKRPWQGQIPRAELLGRRGGCSPVLLVLGMRAAASEARFGYHLEGDRWNRHAPGGGSSSGLSSWRMRVSSARTACAAAPLPLSTRAQPNALCSPISAFATSYRQLRSPSAASSCSINNSSDTPGALINSFGARIGAPRESALPILTSNLHTLLAASMHCGVIQACLESATPH